MRRYSAQNAIVTSDVPHLKIIEDDLWERVQARLAAEAAPTRAPVGSPGAFWEKRRPAHLLTGKAFCGCCGRGLSILGQDYLGCKAAKHGTCRNSGTIRRSVVEAHVLEALGRQLMQPDLLAEFITAFNAEWQTLAATLSAQAAAHQRELAAVERRIGNLVDAISDGRASPSILAKLHALEAQQATLATQVTQVAQAEPAVLPPALHPGIANIYARKIAHLRAALAEGDNPEALEAARALIDRVIISPPDPDGGPPGIEIIGELMALLHAAGVGQPTPEGATAANLDPLALFVRSAKEDQGAEPPPSFPSPTRYSAGRTTTRLAPWRANTAGRYMSDRSAPGNS